METQNPIFIGIDPTAGRQPFTYAALDQGRKLVALAAGDMDQLLAFVDGYHPAAIAVNAPPRLNLGLVRKKLEDQKLASGQLRGSDLRVAENDLRGLGISISPTPSRLEACPTWMQMGFDLHQRLEQAGYGRDPFQESPHVCLETQPHAAFCVLLGQVPLPAPTLEGRLQRQVALYEQGMGIQDPMEFFEELTRRKILHGLLPLEIVYTPEELDTLVAAHMAYCVLNCPQDTMWVGDSDEGQIALPAASLKDHYS